MYHGLADGLIPTGSSVHFYEALSREMGNPTTLSDSFRFFLVTGMHHCFGTSTNAPWYSAGPNQAGMTGTSTFSVPGFSDLKHDAFMALMDWVEEGKAVDNLVATTWVESNNTPVLAYCVSAQSVTTRQLRL